MCIDLKLFFFLIFIFFLFVVDFVLDLKLLT